MPEQNPSLSVNQLLQTKRRSLYDALTEAQAADNWSLVHGILVAICRYVDDPRILEQELRARGFSGLPFDKECIKEFRR